jgi:hypothetical protein
MDSSGNEKLESIRGRGLAKDSFAISHIEQELNKSLTTSHLAQELSSRNEIQVATTQQTQIQPTNTQTQQGDGGTADPKKG